MCLKEGVIRAGNGRHFVKSDSLIKHLNLVQTVAAMKKAIKAFFKPWEGNNV